MIKMISTRIVFVSALVMTAWITRAQNGISVKAAVDKNKILIGEPIRLTLEADIPENESIRFFIIDSLPHFEFLEKGKIDTTNTSNGTILTQIIRITSFDSGHWVIPSFVLTDKIITDTIPVDIGFSLFDPNQAYHDIKDIIEVNPEQKKEEWWWYAAGGGLLLLALLIYLLRKKKPVPVSGVQEIINPYEEAIRQLEQLQKDKPDTKQYYSKLTDILRLYVFRKKGILSLQKTTDDLIIQLKAIGLGKEQFDKLAQALRLSDFVKFAKYIPTPEDDKTCFEEIRQSIMTIEKLESNSSL
jgi:LPXTG-motif cell wall-anchored protein